MSNLGVNKVILIGNAGQDAEVKSTSKGKSVANFSLAINEGLRARGEKAGPRVVWVRCVAWNKLAEIAGNFVKRGKQVFVEGRLQVRRCRDRDGNQEEYSADFVPVEKRFYPYREAGAILDEWFRVRPEEGYLQDKLTVSGLSSALKAEKRAKLAEQLADVVDVRVDTELRIVREKQS